MASNFDVGQRPAVSVPSDYDEHPGLMRLARSVLRHHAAAEDVHGPLARRFVAEGFVRVLDVGCGEGELARHLPEGVSWVGLDNSQTMLERAPAGDVTGEAIALPFLEESFDGVAILYVLYHLIDPRPALAEVYRVLRPGGLISVAPTSRHDSPELAHALPKTPLTFDAELAPGLVRVLFEDLEVKRWEARRGSAALPKEGGELAFAPRGVAHTYANLGHAPTRHLIVCTPAGFERYFARMAAERRGEEPPEWALQPIPGSTTVGPRIGERGPGERPSDRRRQST